MRLSKRGSAALLATVASLLTGVVLFDVYADWIGAGDPLLVTLAENSLPLALLAGLCYVTARLYRSRKPLYLESVARWTIFGLVGILLILTWVIGIQSLQSQFKPAIIVSHTAIGGAIAGVGIGYAVARTKETRRQVASEKERWESLFENDPSGVVDARLGPDGPVVEAANDAFYDLFNLGREEVVGTELQALIDIQESAPEAAAYTNPTDTRELDVDVTVAEEAKHFRLRIVPYGGTDSRNKAFFIYSDITELRETKQQLEENVEKLEASNERLQQFAYIASHDLQEPLRMVSSYMTLLEDEYRDQLDDDAREYIDFAVDGADRMQGMIDGLLEYSRVRTRGEEFTAVDAEAVLTDTLQDLELLIEDASATVTYDQLPVVHADETQLGQLFQNLIENALTHGGEQPEIHVGCERKPDEVVFSVSDDGPGIPESQAESIFELFSQGGRDHGGSGMGLAICDRITDRHGGDIWVDSQAGDGATFYFSMPR